jgi:hypothetical protein
MVWATLVSLSGGCGGPSIKKTTSLPPHSKPIVLDATREELLDKYNEIARGVKSVNSTVDLKPIAGSKYSGVIEEYHEVKAFLLAQRPAQIRMIGQAPVIGTTIFDMASDADTFRVYIPSKTKFLVGSVALERNSNKPIENLRPQHLLEALLWPEVRKEEIVLFEEFNDETARYYVLLSDVHVSDWQPLLGDQEHPASSTPGVVSAFPRQIRIERPHDDYRLDLLIIKLTLNENLPAERFKLEQPAGTELVRVVDTAEEKPPGEKPQ